MTLKNKNVCVTFSVYFCWSMFQRVPLPHTHILTLRCWWHLAMLVPPMSDLIWNTSKLNVNSAVSTLDRKRLTKHDYVTVTQFRIPIIDLLVKKNGKIVQVSFLLLRWRGGGKSKYFGERLNDRQRREKKFQQGRRVIINLLRQPLYNLFGNIVGRGERLKCVDLQMVGGSVVVALCVDNTSNIYNFFFSLGSILLLWFFLTVWGHTVCGAGDLFIYLKKKKRNRKVQGEVTAPSVGPWWVVADFTDEFYEKLFFILDSVLLIKNWN